jgi:NADH-quinone oxidoreductase subunit L
MDDMDKIALYISFLLPLISFIFANITKGKINRNAIIYSCITMMSVSAILFDIVFYNLYLSNKSSKIYLLWNWIDITHTLKANITISLDMLSGVLGIVVLNISALVHIYSLEYMSHDKQQEKFISFLSLFTFFMLILIFADNLLQLFVGWEGVGLCSYLLIGFWYHKASANKAAIKAFIVNRVGDIGLIIAMGLILMTFKSLQFTDILNQQNIVNVMSQKVCSWNMIDMICFCLLIGSMGKSAQIVLHVWLPDAMEGPTPVSALIHAATMVTAGVFLIARCSPIFEQSKVILDLITIIGAITAIFAATVALVQNDIKRIIAYSTCSQLGYMFFALGVSGYSSAIFHLYTHAFFKALLFLSAGSVIHGMNNEQDINKMGGLRKYMPITYIMMTIGSLAIAGIFPFSGFYSKDAILESAKFAYSAVGNFAYIIGLISAFLTAFYSWRLMIIVFHGDKKYDLKHLPHESGKLMITPLVFLAIGALLSGFLSRDMLQEDFWRGSIIVKVQEHYTTSFVEQYLPMIIALSGIIFAYIMYGFKIAKKIPYIYEILSKAYYFDCLYEILFIKTTRYLSKIFYKIFDNNILNSIPKILTYIINSIGEILKTLHTGNVQTYIVMFCSFIALAFNNAITIIPSFEFWIISLLVVSIYTVIILAINQAKQTNLN